MEAEDVAELLGGRQAGESGRAWGALVDYALMDAPRSLARLEKLNHEGHEEHEGKKSEPKGTKRNQYKLSQLKKWSAAFDWQGRVRRVDEGLDRERAEGWLARRAALRERDWTEGGRLREAGLKLLALVEGQPDKATAGQAGDLVVDGSKLQRLAAELETERTAGGGLSREELIHAIEAELARVAGLGPAGVSGAAQDD